MRAELKDSPTPENFAGTWNPHGASAFGEA